MRRLALWRKERSQPREKRKKKEKKRRKKGKIKFVFIFPYFFRDLLTLISKLCKLLFFFVDVDPCMTFILIQLINGFTSNLICLDLAFYVFFL